MKVLDYVGRKKKKKIYVYIYRTKADVVDANMLPATRQTRLEPVASFSLFSLVSFVPVER